VRVGARPVLVGGGESTVEQWWRRGLAGSCELRRAQAGAAGSGSFIGGRRRQDEAQPGQCGGGTESSAWSRALSAMAEGAERRESAFVLY
jgi:hypothetical protein